MKNAVMAANIKRIREALGLTQQELAYRMAVEPETVSRYESGSRRPLGERLERLAAALGVTPEVLAAPPVPTVPEPDLEARVAAMVEAAIRQRLERIRVIDPTVVIGEAPTSADSPSTGASTIGPVDNRAHGGILPPVAVPSGRVTFLPQPLSLDALAALLEQRGRAMSETGLIAAALDDPRLAGLLEPHQAGWLVALDSRGIDGEVVIVRYQGAVAPGWLEWREGLRWLHLMDGPVVPAAQATLVCVLAYRLMPVQWQPNSVPPQPAGVGAH